MKMVCSSDLSRAGAREPDLYTPMNQPIIGYWQFQEGGKLLGRKLSSSEAIPKGSWKLRAVFCSSEAGRLTPSLLKGEESEQLFANPLNCPIHQSWFLKYANEG